MASLLEIDRLTIRFGSTAAVRELNLRVEQGQVLGLVGESGSGKSVTALAVLRLLDPMAYVEELFASAASICWRLRLRR